jgi:hypothetical protein
MPSLATSGEDKETLVPRDIVLAQSKKDKEDQLLYDLKMFATTGK